MSSFTDDHLVWVLKMPVDPADNGASHENIELVGVYSRSANDQKLLRIALQKHCDNDQVAEKWVTQHLQHSSKFTEKNTDLAVMNSKESVHFYIKFIIEENAPVAKTLMNLSEGASATLYTVRTRSGDTLADPDSPMRDDDDDNNAEDKDNGGEGDDEEMVDDEETEDDEAKVRKARDGRRIIDGENFYQIVQSGELEYFIGHKVSTFLNVKDAVEEVKKQTIPNSKTHGYRYGPINRFGVNVTGKLAGDDTFESMSWITKVVASGNERKDDYTLTFED
ncbi:hypothetical protein J4E93_003934 [Alternaria ventricosa]|uniref:uncharacterized protein n=1 Tax=Alternaria ventricosa TaxID=1187951 RepID=UPI0020C2FD26|nr:uncharacterized protein J4E93_003934 [Alternaria ventricosa]KAI4649614.1 hypothetical protein J4E93_003934 [Alternaria ventricosa]